MPLNHILRTVFMILVASSAYAISRQLQKVHEENYPPSEQQISDADQRIRLREAIPLVDTAWVVDETQSSATSRNSRSGVASGRRNRPLDRTSVPIAVAITDSTQQRPNRNDRLISPVRTTSRASIEKLHRNDNARH